ncbi:unnamed protein product [Rhizoctonia solani]|uniref:CHAT domain-containing protein n=1 Tax=Rhizoctonia solani TaxID=456999 RepID=A0A8H3DXA7_9AGAM|nr:unnamed protein product [Rhizoctonia solani]
MATPIHLSQPPIMIDVVQLVATIALASETLAAAAEALAEAARALMEMSQDCAGSQPAGVHNPTHLADQGGSKVDIDQGRVDQHVQASPLKDSRAEKGVASPSKVAQDPGDKPAASSSQSRGQVPGYAAPPGHETNNKFDTLPVSPTSNQPPAAANTSAHIHPQSLKPQQNDPGPVPRPIAKTDPPSQTYVPHEPSGPGTLVRRINFPRRYLIRSDQESAGVPFMAYTALQNKKLVCIIADKESMMARYATALGDITQYRIFRPVTPHCVRITDPTVQSFIKHASPAILLLSPDQPLEIHEISLHIDSIVYWPCAWGIPLETGTFISRFLSRSTLAISYYLLLTTTLKFDPKPYGLVEYPAELIEMILQPGSLFNRVCEAAGPVMNRLELRWTKPTFVLPPGTGFASSTPHINTPRVKYSQLTNTQATPATVLDAMEAHDRVHLACHARQNIHDPTKSGFFLHGDTKDTEATLDLAAINRRSFKKKGLAFLSACQTATGDETLPDEAVHLASGMLMAGYSSVIATMWSVVDEDAPFVADKVYAQLMMEGKLGNGEAGRALHNAVAGLREKAGEKEFGRWVPYIHIGSRNNISDALRVFELKQAGQTARRPECS